MRDGWHRKRVQYTAIYSSWVPRKRPLRTLRLKHSINSLQLVEKIEGWLM